MLGLSALYGGLTGGALGLTGGGGAVLAVPLLVYGLGLPVHEAVTVSLLTVAIAAGAGAIQRASEGLVAYRAGGVFAVTGMAAAPLGGWLGARTPETVLLTGFAFLLVVMAAHMLFRSRVVTVESVLDGPRTPLRKWGIVLLAGTVTGLLSGFFGVGGGFLIVPALLYAAGLPMHRAAATSLFVITLISGAAFGAAVLRGQFGGSTVALPFLAGALGGLLAGSRGARRLSPRALQRVFAVGLLLVAGFIGWQLNA